MRLYVSRSLQPFVVIDGGRKVADALPFVRAAKFAWYIFTLGEQFFVLSLKETRERLSNSRDTNSLAKTLNLVALESSPVIPIGRGEWINLPELPKRGTTRSRAVFLRKRQGNEQLVGAVGTIQKAEPLLVEYMKVADRSKLTIVDLDRLRETPVRIGAKRSPAKKAAAKKEVLKKAVPKGSDLRLLIGDSRIDLIDGGGPQVEPPTTEFDTVSVMYATDREPKISGKQGRLKYLNRLASPSKLSYGVCQVTIPANHRLGKMETPSMWRLQIHDDPEKHFTIQDCAAKTRSEFFQIIKAIVETSDGKSAFVFIHGYNVAFDDAVKRTAQLSRDMKFPGIPVLYSWASAANTLRYPKDEETIAFTEGRLKTFLEDIRSKSGAEVVHLIAHSMGNRALLRALNLSRSSGKRPPGKFKQVVLTAPDVARTEVEELVESAKELAERVTLYASRKDKPLLASRLFHSSKRLGFVYGVPFFFAGVDSVDASRVHTDLMGHSVFSSARSVLSDLSEVIRHGEHPRQRFELEELKTPDGLCWTFKK
jgi:esterase/lipase superfamily enzyme